ncbi:MAG: hypothetical protein ACRDM7_12050 [Thermoleophilaceae bacterium]
MAELDLVPGYGLIYDIGCFHGLSDEGRRMCAKALRDLAGSSAHLLVMGFAPGRRGPIPRGINEGEVVTLFGDAWNLVDVSAHDPAELPFFLRKARPTWYHLVRSQKP